MDRRATPREAGNRNQNQFLSVGRKVTTAFMPIYLCFGRRPSQSESRRSATCHNKRRNAHHHKRAMASPRYSTRARVRDCAPTNNTHPTTQRRRRRRRRRSTTPALPITTRAQTRTNERAEGKNKGVPRRRNCAKRRIDTQPQTDLRTQTRPETKIPRDERRGRGEDNRGVRCPG